MSEPSERLIITGSFNGLLDRLAKLDHFGVWLDLKARIKAARKQKREPTMRMPEVLTATGLSFDDV